MARKHSIALLFALLCLTAPTAAQAIVIDDPANDANAVGNTGLSVATGPVSDASRDITRVAVTRDTSGITVRWSLSAAPQKDGPVTFAILRGTRGLCGVSLVVSWGMGDGPIALSDLDDCDEEFLGIGAPGYSATISGSTVTARYPYAALRANRMGIGPSTRLESLRGETLVGTFHSSGGFTSCDPDCPNEGFSYAKSGFLGPIIDVTDQGATLAATVRGPSARATRRRA